MTSCPFPTFRPTKKKKKEEKKVEIDFRSKFRGIKISRARWGPNLNCRRFEEMAEPNTGAGKISDLEVA